MSFLHGISVTETAAAPVTLATVATAVIGIVVTAPLADAALFPLNRPVVIGQEGGPVSLADAIAKAGATGTLKPTLQAIADQVRAPVVVVRVAPGADDSATAVAVIGANVAGVRTGIQALLAAEAQTGFRPRIIGAPGLDYQDVAGIDGEDVVVALATAAQRLRGMAYAQCRGIDRPAAITYRADFQQRELMLIWPAVTVAGAAGSAVARALGLRAQIDQTTGFHKTLSNVPVAGIDGLTRDVAFDLQDPDTDAQLLNAAGVTTLVRLNGALRFWGNRTCSLDPNFAFESATRTAQVLADTIVIGLSPYLDRPLVPSLARDIVEEINELFRRLKRAGKILGATAWFDPTRNPIDSLKAGKLVIRYRYTPVPPLENLGLVQEISDEFLADFGSLTAAG